MVEYTSMCNHPATSTVTNSWPTSLHTLYLQTILRQTPALISGSVSISGCISERRGLFYHNPLNVNNPVRQAPPYPYFIGEDSEAQGG